jgi:Ankyrin repeats (3 copies)/Planctomycete cytochrome C
VKLHVAALVAASMGAVAFAGQPPSTIDFQRDVQPIFRDHCISCHGPEIQMNGFRLDRRADAMRGATQTNIGPHNAEGSRLYHRLIGTSFGARMPPGAPLSARQIEIVKQWIDEGAHWPDEASGEKTGGDDPATVRLMTAALHGDTATVKRLLDGGANPNAANNAGATALMWAVPDVATMRLLLDAGADVDARSDDNRSALVVASGIAGASPAVTFLLDYGADQWVSPGRGMSPLRESARVGDPDTFRVLLAYGATMRDPGAPPVDFVRTACHKCAEQIHAGPPLPRRPPQSEAAATAPKYDPGRAAFPTPVGPTPATPAALRAAIGRSLPLLQDVGVSFIAQTGCVSCHHNSLVSMAVQAARAHGYTVNEAIAKKQASTIGIYLESWRERTLQNMFIAGQQDTISYLLLGLAADEYPPDAATEAQAIWLKRRQLADGHWPVTTIRPPIESNDIEVTAVSMRALQKFAPAWKRDEYAKAIDLARVWLVNAEADETEERAFRLLGLSWANAPRAPIAEAARQLLATQRADGGWAQLETMGSDAYATGQALVALRESGAADLNNRAYRKGIEYLLRTQIDDGSWQVESRAIPIQAYFESGFPYGVNQWVSAAATAWATMALALAQ